MYNDAAGNASKWIQNVRELEIQASRLTMANSGIFKLRVSLEAYDQEYYLFTEKYKQTHYFLEYIGDFLF